MKGTCLGKERMSTPKLPSFSLFNIPVTLYLDVCLFMSGITIHRCIL